MSASILRLLGVLTWIWVYPNAKTAGSRVMWHSLAEYKDLSVSNAMVLTNQKTIPNLDGTARQMKKQTPLDLKQKKGNCVHTCSNIWTVGETTKPTQINVHSGDISSTKSGNRRNTLRFMKTESSQFAPWGVSNFNNDFTKPQNIFAKCLKEFTHCQHHTWDSNSIWYHLNLGTSLVQNP